MNDIKIFENPSFGQVRTVMQNNEPWFVAADVCRALELGTTAKAVERLDEDEKGMNSIHTPGGEQQVTIINEPGLYSLVLGSRKPEAKAFKRWITHDILPALRKHGVYATDPATDKMLRAQAMLMNAKTRQYQAIMKTLADKPRLAPIAVEVFGLKAIEAVTGANMDNYLPECDKTYSASEVGKMFGLTSMAIGKLANKHGLKCPTYGRYVMDKSRYSDKQVESFRYNDEGIVKIERLLGRQ